jgi:cysteinyl-tRNA synthetase
MSKKLLGETFDIHGGGLDLVFPHHENEIAQSECRHGKPLARYWLHNGLMQASNEAGKLGGRNTRQLDASGAAAGEQATQEAGKMAKSKGATAFSELLTRYQPEAIRFFLLSTHYRHPIDYSEDRIAEVEKGLDTFYRFFKRYARITGQSFYDVAAPGRRDEREAAGAFAEHRRRFLESMDDDFNTGGAIGDLFELVRALNKLADERDLELSGRGDAEAMRLLREGTVTLRELAATLGLFRRPVESRGGGGELVSKLMELVIQVRADARQSKNFAMADKIRQGLSELGITLEDRPSGTDWTMEKAEGRRQKNESGSGF